MCSTGAATLGFFFSVRAVARYASSAHPMATMSAFTVSASHALKVAALGCAKSQLKIFIRLCAVALTRQAQESRPDILIDLTTPPWPQWRSNHTAREQSHTCFCPRL